MRWPKGHAGAILAAIEENGFTLVGFKKTRLSLAQAQAFYAVHKERPFYNDLVKFMTEGPVVVMVLERQTRSPMAQADGGHSCQKADAGTLRKRFAESIQRNAVHGSDAPEIRRRWRFRSSSRVRNCCRGRQ